VREPVAKHGVIVDEQESDSGRISLIVNHDGRNATSLLTQAAAGRRTHASREWRPLGVPPTRRNFRGHLRRKR
jgi:hypothetical protein